MGDGVTIAEFESLCQTYAKVRDEQDAAKEVVSNLETQRRELESQIIACLDQYGKARWDISHIGTVSVKESFSFKTPKTPEAKKALFEYLKEKNCFDDLVSVNSQTLNAFAKREMELARDEGKVDFQIPGLEEPTLYKTISLKRGG